MWETDQPVLVGVTPAGERSRRRRLLDTLEDAYPVRFEGRDPNALDGLDALVRFPGADAGSPPPGSLPVLSYLGEESASSRRRSVVLADDALLARPLRDARLSEDHAAGAPALRPAAGERTVATLDDAPAWSIRDGDSPSPHHAVAVAPAELAPGQALRSRLAPGRCLGLLALSHFIRHLTAATDWSLPPVRAAFVIDDPNLRRPTYGHISYRKLAASAIAHRYHTSIAMVPLDARSFHSTAVRLFRDHREQLSLCVHGNDHLRDELRSPRSVTEGRIPATQAMIRSRAFELRTGLTIDRVMVAPHERLGEAATRALSTCGYEGFSSTRPYPWLDYASDLSWLSRPAHAGPLVGWHPVQSVAPGLLALLRIDFSHPREELVIRAFLSQPLIMYGHHDLLRRGTGELEQAAAEINRLGDVRWESLGAIARSSVTTRRRGSTLEVRIPGRRAAFDVPAGVTDVLVHGDAGETSSGVSLSGPVRLQGESAPAAVTRLKAGGPGRVEIGFEQRPETFEGPMPKPSIRSLVRRLAAEGRDRTSSKLAWASR